MYKRLLLYHHSYLGTSHHENVLLCTTAELGHIIHVTKRNWFYIYPGRIGVTFTFIHEKEQSPPGSSNYGLTELQTLDKLWFKLTVFMSPNHKANAFPTGKVFSFLEIQEIHLLINSHGAACS